ncbi:DUF4390 domain-containing protein [Wenzhouxiangella sp. AB-CW3]|uniref:DUF4390 domain-containing protein n=1 Tax=Wenzhouxiangella sp. AB-CW3 TaxID=2771012 RepID=UPI00168AC6A6|nr:DUF4390 domain-containing protein [Wenzhouxiangella sp. AB-CW3]QOC22290.1 DUF4390 domain-containing protein [Wenzhouxiangella sp. AB-CW3]
MVFSVLLLVGCSQNDDHDWHIELIEPALERDEDGYDIVSGIRFEPSPAMIEALERGVTLTVALQTRATGGPVFVSGLDRIRKHRLEISYLPLSRHYQLVYLRDDSHSSFPRLSMLLNALEAREPWSVKLEGDELDRGPWRVQARAELDRSRLPSPMRLPAWLDPQWRVRSDWQEWSTERVEVDAQ